jgi:type IV secretion system protein VirB9
MFRSFVIVVCSLLTAGAVFASPQHDSAHADDIGTPVSRRVRYSEQDVVALYGHVRFTTMIVLPPDERILDFICGDKEFWIVNGDENLAYVKPAKPGAQTNLNLVTASGHVYSFLLTEISDPRGRTADLKVYLDLADTSISLTAPMAKPAFVSAQQLEDYRTQIELAQDAARRAATEADAKVAAYQSTYPVRLRFDYRVAVGQKPFLITAMYHDEKFTYIQAKAAEPPTLYEMKDDRPSLVDYVFTNGVYVVGKVLDSGYFAIGSKRLAFTRTE